MSIFILRPCVADSMRNRSLAEKLAFLRQASEAGYTVVVCFIGIAGLDVSEERVAMRISQGGHDVPPEELMDRFPRTLADLKHALAQLPHVWVFDNSDLRKPFRLIAVSENGTIRLLNKPVPPMAQTPAALTR